MKHRAKFSTSNMRARCWSHRVSAATSCATPCREGEREGARESTAPSHPLLCFRRVSSYDEWHVESEQPFAVNHKFVPAADVDNDIGLSFEIHPSGNFIHTFNVKATVYNPPEQGTLTKVTSGLASTLTQITQTNEPRETKYALLLIKERGEGKSLACRKAPL